MAPKKRLGVGAECTVAIWFLHPKNKIKQCIPDFSSTAKLSSYIVQRCNEHLIRMQSISCIIFRHERFGGQELWCLSKYILVNKEGLEAIMFTDYSNKTDGMAGAAAGAATTEQDNKNFGSRDEDGRVDHHGLGIPTDLLPDDIANVIGNQYLDDDDIMATVAVALMIDNDNMSAPKNFPNVSGDNGATQMNNIMLGWQHNRLWMRKMSVSTNIQPYLSSLPCHDSTNMELTNLQLFELFFSKQFIMTDLLPESNKNLRGLKPLTYGEFLRWIGLWLLMASIVRPQRHEFWSMNKMNAFAGAPFRSQV